MNARLQSLPAARTGRTDLALALLGTGGVGHALLAQLARCQESVLSLAAVANSRRQLALADGIVISTALPQLGDQAPGRADGELLEALDCSGALHRVIVDATASAAVAGLHPTWLARGYHVVTANKALNGGSLADWRAIGEASRGGGGRYGVSATVGAGLPVIDTLKRWHSCGDRITAIEGVFSGSLSWLFNNYDGQRPFSELLAEASVAGYCEPDARQDLSGADAARKLLILARSAGIELDLDQVEVENLVPKSLRDTSEAEFKQEIRLLDSDMARRHAAAQSKGRVLRYLACFDAHGARVGLQAVEPHHPVAQLQGTDNLFALSSDNYDLQPLIIRGPGAGTRVTAQALLADILQIAHD